MTDNDFHARRTELANAFATAGADLLAHMPMAAGALAAIPNTAQYVVVGDPAAIRAQLDTVDPQRRMRHGDRPELPLYFGAEAGQERRWAALITSAGHGILQEYGTAFEHAQPGQEVLEVMEILPGAPAIARSVAREVAAQADQVAVLEWQPIETAPKTGRTLLLGCFNELGNWRTMRGQWFSQATIADEWEEPDGAEEGWYETAVEPDVPNCWSISPTHWMPLPAAPSPAKESK